MGTNGYGGQFHTFETVINHVASERQRYRAGEDCSVNFASTWLPIPTPSKGLAWEAGYRSTEA